MRTTVRKSSLPDSQSRLKEINQAAPRQPDCFSGSENSPGRFSSTPPLILPFCRYPLAIRRGLPFGRASQALMPGSRRVSDEIIDHRWVC